ncbi:uncharacterized protein BO97DRAFT_461218 [Aspergillus homomorphus CBS 101889]|uniref:Cytochrome P450 n=1 Tax=Aspergillus homomorphus (strain CBS 101889) TaxID=1450537 RepID=A0A395I6Q3_ASPHC|nr:hypothetical protein BO97DRAFT_461218 [Aspergillus homomorphus CBS 101889]RAL15545.1 hypothetical protein BO97DRAFT_461218 [Aspergillus homomorphus CBS 101889]
MPFNVLPGLAFAVSCALGSDCTSVLTRAHTHNAKFNQYLVYHALYAIYMLWLSPLASVPGPATRKFSYLPCAFQSFCGREAHAVRDLHGIYGPVVRSGYRRLRPGVPDLLAANGPEHARQRAALNRAFAERALREQEHYFQDHIDLFLQRLDLRCAAAETVKMVQWVEFLAFDLIGTLAFSSSLQCLESQQYHPWVTLLMNFFKSTHYFLTARWGRPGGGAVPSRGYDHQRLCARGMLSPGTLRAPRRLHAGTLAANGGASGMGAKRSS